MATETYRRILDTLRVCEENLGQPRFVLIHFDLYEKLEGELVREAGRNYQYGGVKTELLEMLGIQILTDNSVGVNEIVPLFRADGTPETNLVKVRAQLQRLNEIAAIDPRDAWKPGNRRIDAS